MVFLKLVHTEYHVNHKTQPFRVAVAYLYPMFKLAGHFVGTTLPHHKQMDLMKKNINMNLLFFDNKFFVLNKIFEVLDPLKMLHLGLPNNLPFWLLPFWLIHQKNLY